MGDMFRILVIVGLLIVAIGALLAWLNNALAAWVIKSGVGLVVLAVVLYVIFFALGQLERVG